MRPAKTEHLRRVADGGSTTGGHLRAALGALLLRAGRTLTRVGARALHHPSEVRPVFSLQPPTEPTLAERRRMQRDWRRAAESRRRATGGAS